MAESDARDRVDCIIVGAGPAGLSAALNLSRSRVSVLVADSGRPRNAATLKSHGFLTRDGISPNELRRLGRDELQAFPDTEIAERRVVSAVTKAVDPSDRHPFLVELTGRSSTLGRQIRARTILVATGLRETLPAIPSIRAYYGMSIFSCAMCDGWELRDRPLALIGESDDLYTRARHLARWTDTLTVFTNGIASLSVGEESELVTRGIRVDRRTISDLDGNRGAVSAVRLTDGDYVPILGGLIRPIWHPNIEFLNAFQLDTDIHGHVAADDDGRTSVAGIYTAGDVTSPGPQQLIVAAGAGARAAAAITLDLEVSYSAQSQQAATGNRWL